MPIKISQAESEILIYRNPFIYVFKQLELNKLSI